MTTIALPIRGSDTPCVGNEFQHETQRECKGSRDALMNMTIAERNAIQMSAKGEIDPGVLH